MTTERVKQRPTIYAIDLNQEFLHGSVVCWSRPVESRRVGSNSGQRYIGGLGNVHSKDADEIGRWFPKSLPGAVEQPSQCQKKVVRMIARIGKSGSKQQDKAGRGRGAWVKLTK